MTIIIYRSPFEGQDGELEQKWRHTKGRSPHTKIYIFCCVKIIITLSNILMLCLWAWTWCNGCKQKSVKLPPWQHSHTYGYDELEQVKSYPESLRLVVWF